MLSILIPTYNYNITRLVADLHQQASDTYVDFEIIVMEDGSTQWAEENKAVNDFEYCTYIVLRENVGRSAVRNRLADEARYNHLLFLDCDSELRDKHFIKNYLVFCKEQSVVLGGRIYDENDTDPDKSLIITYGRKRERYNLGMEQKINKMFMTPNFLISKFIFNKIRFDETIIGYGHEDTIFGIELQQHNIDFTMIDNPVIHKGLEDNATFLLKTEEGVRNLLRLYNTGRYPLLAVKSKLLNTYIRIYKAGLTLLLATVFKVLKHSLRYQLCRPSPSLRLYDFYKLLFMCETSVIK